MLGGRDALDLWGEVDALSVVMQGGTLRDEEAGHHRMVEPRPFMPIDLGGFFAPTERRLRPPCLVKVVLAPIKLANRRAVFHGRAPTSVLV
jgi:hypothetical protein